MSDISATHCSSEIVSFADCAGWAEDDHRAAFYAFLKSAEYAVSHSYKSGILGPQFEDLLPVFAAARDLASQKKLMAKLHNSFLSIIFSRLNSSLINRIRIKKAVL